MRQTAYAGQQPERRRDEGPTPESIDRARIAQNRERAAFTKDTGVWVKPNGQMYHRTRGCAFDLRGTLKAFEDFPGSASQFDGFFLPDVSTLVH